MKPALVEDYRNPIYATSAKDLLNHFLLEEKRVPYQSAVDSFILHFKPWTSIVFNPRVKSAWKTLLEQYYRTDAYKKLNEAVATDPMLAKYATISFLNNLYKTAKDYTNRHRDEISQNQGSAGKTEIENFIESLDSKKTSFATRYVEACIYDFEYRATELLKEVYMIKGFSHFGVPVARLLSDPDEFRSIISNRIVVNLYRMLHKLHKEAPNLKQTRVPTLVGGRPLGVKQLQRISELTRIVPYEFIDDDILSYKIASRTVKVTEQYGSIQNYVVYLDKSGSMAETIEYVEGDDVKWVNKISFATASALALAKALRRIGAKLTLKLFDTEVHDPITDYAELLRVLTRVSADSGTNITYVLEDALRYKNEKIVIVTDGIDEVSEEAVKKAKSLDITVLFIDTDNELLRDNFPCIHIKEAKPDVLLRI